MNRNEWHLFDDSYIKEFYDVRLPDDTIIKHCWPNAGYLTCINDDTKKFKIGDLILIRLSKDHPAN